MVALLLFMAPSLLSPACSKGNVRLARTIRLWGPDQHEALEIKQYISHVETASPSQSQSQPPRPAEDSSQQGSLPSFKLLGVLTAKAPGSHVYPDVPGPFIALEFDAPKPFNVSHHQMQWQQTPRRSCWDIAKEVGSCPVHGCCRLNSTCWSVVQMDHGGHARGLHWPLGCCVTHAGGRANDSVPPAAVTTSSSSVWLCPSRLLPMAGQHHAPPVHVSA
jgi:hypothetical protein